MHLDDKLDGPVTDQLHDQMLTYIVDISNKRVNKWRTEMSVLF